MKNSNGNTVPANKAEEVKAGPVKLLVTDPTILAHAQRLTLATEGEAKARTDAAALVEGATVNTWNELRNLTVSTLKELGHENADLVLNVYLSGAKLAGGMLGTRATQYAANLRRMVKATALGKELPAHILTCGRAAYLDDAFWLSAGVLAKTGTKKGNATTAAGKAANANKSQATPEAKEMANDAKVSDAAAKANTDKGMLKLAGMLAQLHGTFRNEAYDECAAVCARILQKQAKASGTGSH